MAKDTGKKTKGEGRRTNLEDSVKGLEGMEGGAWFKPQAGKNLVRIAPAFHTKGPYKGLFYNKKLVHQGITIEGRIRGVACCKNWNPDNGCPTCDFINHLMESGEERNAKLAKKIRPQEVFFVNLIDRKDNKVKKYGLKKGMMKTIRGYLIDDDYGDITDAESGRDITIDKSGEGLSTKYEIKVKPKESEINQEGWEDDLFDIFADGECTDKLSEGAVYGIMKGSFGKAFTKAVDAPKGSSEEEGEEDETEEEDDKNKKGKGKKKGPDFDEMDRDELKKYIKDNDLDVTVKKSMSDEDIREAIEEELNEKPPFSTDDEEED